jgi:hypothetical protein
MHRVENEKLPVFQFSCQQLPSIRQKGQFGVKISNVWNMVLIMSKMYWNRLTNFINKKFPIVNFMSCLTNTEFSVISFQFSPGKQCFFFDKQFNVEAHLPADWVFKSWQTCDWPLILQHDAYELRISNELHIMKIRSFKNENILSDNIKWVWHSSSEKEENSKSFQVVAA